jgi:hypothetical protein
MDILMIQDALKFTWKYNIEHDVDREVWGFELACIGIKHAIERKYPDYDTEEFMMNIFGEKT